jgi:hypothetical protein
MYVKSSCEVLLLSEFTQHSESVHKFSFIVNPSSEILAVPCGQAGGRTDGQT